MIYYRRSPQNIKNQLEWFLKAFFQFYFINFLIVFNHKNDKINKFKLHLINQSLGFPLAFYYYSSLYYTIFEKSSSVLVLY
jgi:hypothetical protein